MTQSSENGTTVYQNGSSSVVHTNHPAASTYGLASSQPELEPEGLDLKDDEDRNFTVLYRSGIADLISKVASRKLLNRDLLVFLVYITHSDWRTGRCRLTVQKASQILTYKVASVQTCVKRLKRENLLVPIKDSKTGEKLHIVSPYIIKVGSGQSRGYLTKLYHDAIKKNKPAIQHLADSHPAGDDLEDPDYFDEL